MGTIYTQIREAVPAHRGTVAIFSFLKKSSSTPTDSIAKAKALKPRLATL